MKERRKILCISSGDTFGSYEFIYRMAKSMEQEYQIAMLVREKRKTDRWIYKIPVPIPHKRLIQRSINYLKKKIGINTEVLSTKKRYCFLTSEDETAEIISADKILNYLPFVPEIVFSGMTDGFINTTTLLNFQKRTGAKIFQVMIDMSLLTGGCHVVNDCKEFINNCGSCPAINNKKFQHFPNKNLFIKKKNIQNGNFELLVVPGWSHQQAKLSNIYKDKLRIISCSVIDTDVFANNNRKIARQVFNIPDNYRVIFAGSNNAKDERKGRVFLVEALSLLWEKFDQNVRDNICILLAGNHNSEDSITAGIKFQKKLIPFITDDHLLSLAYQSADVFVCPSLEDAGPMMVAEALACGTPVVGFETGLLLDDTLVKTGFNGFRVKMKDTQELALSISKIMTLNEGDYNIISENARNSAIRQVSNKAFLDSISDL